MISDIIQVLLNYVLLKSAIYSLQSDIYWLPAVDLVTVILTSHVGALSERISDSNFRDNLQLLLPHMLKIDWLFSDFRIWR